MSLSAICEGRVICLRQAPPVRLPQPDERCDESGGRHTSACEIMKNTSMRILFIGDIVGKPGRDLTRRGVPLIVSRFGIELVIANVENAAGGAGITRDVGETIRDYGVDIMTSGNHIWDKKEAINYIGLEPRLLRPANYPSGVPGHGRYVARTAAGDPVAVINVMGRVFMLNTDNPFTTVLDEIEAIGEQARLIVVDVHAEATSEKLAMGWHLDGRVTAVVGTHTHVQTADQQILPGGTAYITDVGMNRSSRLDYRGGQSRGSDAVSDEHALSLRTGDRRSKTERRRRHR